MREDVDPAPLRNSADSSGPTQGSTAPRQAVSTFARPARAVPPSPASARPLAHTPAGVSLHVQQGPAGVQIWLGIPGPAVQAAAASAALVAAVRRHFESAGKAVDSIVCNGVDVYAADPSAAPQT